MGVYLVFVKVSGPPDIVAKFPQDDRNKILKDGYPVRQGCGSDQETHRSGFMPQAKTPPIPLITSHRRDKPETLSGTQTVRLGNLCERW